MNNKSHQTCEFLFMFYRNTYKSLPLCKQALSPHMNHHLQRKNINVKNYSFVYTFPICIITYLNSFRTFFYFWFSASFRAPEVYFLFSCLISPTGQQSCHVRASPKSYSTIESHFPFSSVLAMSGCMYKQPENPVWSY